VGTDPDPSGEGISPPYSPPPRRLRHLDPFHSKILGTPLRLCDCFKEREAAYEREQKLIQIEKEKEVARLRALQERARDEQAERDEIRARRAQEQAEREWRRKEAEEIQRQVETEAMLREARQQQMAQREHFLAVEAQRERAEFDRVLRYLFD